MKRKLLYLYTLLLTICSAGILTGCSNEDIDIQGHGDLEIRVSTQYMYDTFNMTDNIKSRFLSGDYSIGVTLFIYDDKGNLVEKYFKSSKTFEALNFNCPGLREGKYTFVVGETLVETETQESADWEYENEENLSTLEIANREYINDEGKPERDYVHYWYSVVGTHATSQYLDFKQSTRIDLTPKPIGTIFNLNAINLAESKYTQVIFITKDAPIGRYLSPEYKGSDIFHDDNYNTTTWWALRGYDNIVSGYEKDSFDVYMLESGEITYKFGLRPSLRPGATSTNFDGWPANNGYITTIDGNRYYGGIAFLSNPDSPVCATAMFSERSQYTDWESQIISSLSNQKVEYIEPCLEWGATTSDVDNHMVQLKGSTNFTTQQGDYNYWSFINYNETIQYDYRFDSSWSNYNSLLMVFDKTKYPLETVNNLLGQLSLVNEGFVEELNGYMYTSQNTLALAYYLTSYPDKLYVLFIQNTVSAPKKSADLLKVAKNADFKMFTIPKNNRLLLKKSMCEL